MLERPCEGVVEKARVQHQLHTAHNYGLKRNTGKMLFFFSFSFYRYFINQSMSLFVFVLLAANELTVEAISYILFYLISCTPMKKAFKMKLTSYKICGKIAKMTEKQC